MQWIDYVGPGFTLEVPSTWRAVSSTQFAAMFLRPNTDAAIRPNLVIAIQRVAEDVTAEGVAASALEQQKVNYQDYSLLDERAWSTNDSEGVLRSYTWFNADKNTGVVQNQCVYRKHQLIYTITSSRSSNDPDGTYLDEAFERMITSFTATEIDIQV